MVIVAEKTEVVVVEAGETRDIVCLNESGFRKAEVHRDATVNWYVAVNGDSDLKIQSHVVGEGGCSNIYFVFTGAGSSKLDLFAGNIFDAPNCTGDIVVKGVVRDNAKSKFVGEIDITLKGGGTDSYLKQDVLMMDPTARVDAVPSLEIKTNDVKASHGVSITRLTDQDIFYLTSRGIPKDVSEKLILDGFLADICSKFPSEEVNDLLHV